MEFFNTALVNASSSALSTLFGYCVIWKKVIGNEIDNLKNRIDSVALRSRLHSPNDQELCQAIVKTIAYSVNDIVVTWYKVDYGNLFSSIRGESEKNFERLIN